MRAGGVSPARFLRVGAHGHQGHSAPMLGNTRRTRPGTGRSRSPAHICGQALRYGGSTCSDAVNSFKIPDRLLFDIGAHYDFGQGLSTLKGLRAQVAISHLTTKYYITSCGGTYSCHLGQGRKIYGNLTYDW